MFKEPHSFWERCSKGLCTLLLVALLSLAYLSYTYIVKSNAQAEEIMSLQGQLESAQAENSQLTSMLDVDGRGYSFNDTIVYANGSGEKYHKENCQYVKSSSIAMFLTDAERSGYTKCSLCY